MLTVGRRRITPGIYFGILMSYPTVTGFVRLVSDGQFLFGQRIDVFAQLLMAILAVLLAAFSSHRPGWPRAVKVFLGVLVIVWIPIMVIIVSHGDDFRREFLSIPFAGALLLWRPLGFKDLTLAIKIQLVTISVAVLLLLPPFLGTEWPLGQIAWRFEVSAPVSYRWGAFTFGPFIFGTLLGGAALAGLCLNGYWKLGGVAMGAVGIYLADSEGVYLATSAAVVVLVLAAPVQPKVKAGLASATLVASALLALYFAQANPTGSGRTPIWSRYLEIFPESLWIGFGTSGIPEAVGPLRGEMVEGIVFHHGHNMFIDALVRTGLVGALCYAIVFGVAGVVTGKAAFKGFAPPAALFTFLLIAALLDYSVPIEYWSFGSSLLVLSVLLAGRQSEYQSTIAPRDDQERSMERHSVGTKLR